MENPWYLFVVYGLIWVGIFAYARHFSGRQRALEQEADRLAGPSLEGSREDVQ